MDDDLGPGLLLSHSSDLLVKFLNLPFHCGEVRGKFLFSESIDRGEGEVSPVVPLDSRQLRVRYNHSERKNHTKFFAKLFSHWLKTPLFRLHPLFYREKSQPHHDTMSSSH